MSQVKLNEAEIVEGVASVYGAALARKTPPFLSLADAPGEEENEPVSAPFTGTALTLNAAPGEPALSDWSGTIGLVERAAATIKAYERRFVQLDIHTRALIERSSEEQMRLQGEITSLEGRLREAEERAAKAEAQARDEAFYRWEAERRCREAEDRIADAEAYSQHSEDYLRRVHTILSQV